MTFALKHTEYENEEEGGGEERRRWTLATPRRFHYMADFTEQTYDTGHYGRIAVSAWLRDILNPLRLVSV